MRLSGYLIRNGCHSFAANSESANSEHEYDILCELLRCEAVNRSVTNGLQHTWKVQ